MIPNTGSSGVFSFPSGRIGTDSLWPRQRAALEYTDRRWMFFYYMPLASLYAAMTDHH